MQHAPVVMGKLSDLKLFDRLNADFEVEKFRPCSLLSMSHVVVITNLIVESVFGDRSSPNSCSTRGAQNSFLFSLPIC